MINKATPRTSRIGTDTWRSATDPGHSAVLGVRAFDGPGDGGEERLARALGTILRTLMIVLALILATSLLSGMPLTLRMAIGAALASMAPLYLMHRLGLNRAAAMALVLTLLAFATVAIATFGSIRGSGSLAFIGAAFVGGMLLGRTALLLTVAVSSALIGGLIWLENGAMLPAPDLRVGVQHWIIHSAVIASVAAVMFLGRSLLLESIARLDKSERRLATLFRSSPAALVVTRHPEGRVIEINAAYERIFAASREDVVGGAVLESRAWCDAAEHERYLAELLTHGRVADFRTRLLRYDGSAFEALVSAETIADDEGQLRLSVVTDLSGEAQARAQLQRSEERFRLAFDVSPIGMTITRVSDGRYLAVNRADQRTLGYSREEMLGRTTIERGAWLEPAAREHFIDKLHRERSVENFETRMRNKSGQIVTCSIWAALVELDGEPCVLASTINITDRKSEEALISEVAQGVSGDTGEPFLRSLVEHLAAATRTDLAFVGELVDDGARIRTLARWCGRSLASGTEYGLAGTPCEMALGANDVVLLEDGIGARFPADPVVREGGYRGYVGMPLRDPEGRHVGILSVLSRQRLRHPERMRSLFHIFAARAQSELLRMRHEQEIRRFSCELESRVRERTEQYESANRELEAFSYSVSHDLRAPLRAIDGFTKLLQVSLEGRLDAAERETFGRVLSSVRRMRELIDDLLGLARLTRGQMSKSRVDLSALAREIAEMLGSRAASRKVHFAVEPGMEAWCDRNLVRIVLENLLDNAWKFTGRRSEAAIHCGTVVLEDGGRAFFVRDNGAGFDLRYARRLFSPFQRLHGKDEFEGTGIGLATVQRIIVRHGGRVWAESRVDGGATIFFTLEGMPPVAGG